MTEGGALAVPLLVTATVPVPFFHLFAEAAKRRPLAVAGWVSFAVAAVASLPVARM